jgi:hypothetical protein
MNYSHVNIETRKPRVTLQEILQEVYRLTSSMSPEKDEYHLQRLEKGGQVLAIFSRTGAMVKADRKEDTRHLAVNALCKQSMKSRGNAKLLHLKK